MGAGNTQCWAGDIVERNGRYFWFFSNHNRETGVMVADHPEGPYHDAIGGPLVDSFDPTVFVEDDGTSYLIYGRDNYRIVRLKDSMIELDEEPRTIAIDRKGVFPLMDRNSVHKRNGIMCGVNTRTGAGIGFAIAFLQGWNSCPTAPCATVWICLSQGTQKAYE